MTTTSTSTPPAVPITTRVETDKEDWKHLLQTVGMQAKEHVLLRHRKRASVLVPLFLWPTPETSQDKDDNKDSTASPPPPAQPELHVLLTQRPWHLNSHPGEVCCPGGRQDAQDDGNDWTTAVREAWEEVGLHARAVTPLCRLPAVESKHGLCVTPMVGVIDWNRQAHERQQKSPESAAADPNVQTKTTTITPTPPTVTNGRHDWKNWVTASPDEVEAVFSVPLSYFLESQGHLSEEKYAVEWTGGQTFWVRTYLYPKDDKDNQNKKDNDNKAEPYRIWGLTAHIVHQVACLAYLGRLDETKDQDDTKDDNHNNKTTES